MKAESKEASAIAPAHGYASREAAEAAIHALSDDDYLKLSISARFHLKTWGRGVYVQWEELLGEAVLRTLNGKRQWRRSVVSIVRHLDRTMESLARHALDEKKSEAELRELIRAEEVDPRTSAPRRVIREDAQTRLIAREQIDEIEAMFADAPQALALVRLKAEGYTESEIIKQLGIDKRAYEAARKKVERELAKYVLRQEEATNEKAP